MPGVAQLFSPCFGQDFTVEGAPWVGGMIIGCWNGNIIAEGRPIAAQGDMCQAFTGGVGTVLSKPRNILLQSRPIACERDFVVGLYQGWIISGASTIQCSF